MILWNTQFFLDLPGVVLAYISGMSAKIFLTPGGSMSLASLLSALCIALLWMSFSRRERRKPIRMRVLIRAVLPKRLIRSPSGKADIGFFLFNTFVAGLLLGWAFLSYQLVSKAAHGQLVAHLGTIEPSALSDFQMSCILTLALFVAYELGYYIDHYLSHRVPFLWEFHKVHHTAEVLSPLTNSRVHPVDTIVFYNILAVVMGCTGGLLNYLFGKTAVEFTLGNSNIIALTFTYLIGHLHHTHFWIAFTGIWGRLFISPAHHQIHHSTNPIHFNRNLGSVIGVFDWMFGTLHVPARRREKLSFGVEPIDPRAHTATGMMLTPVLLAIEHLKPSVGIEVDAQTKAGATQPI